MVSQSVIFGFFGVACSVVLATHFGDERVKEIDEKGETLQKANECAKEKETQKKRSDMN